MYCSKVGISDLHLVVNMTQGSICDYSIFKDSSRVSNASFHRGDILLHPHHHRRKSVPLYARRLCLQQLPVPL